MAFPRAQQLAALVLAVGDQSGNSAHLTGRQTIFPEPLWAAPILALLIGYLLGSIPFGLILTRLAGEGDLRAIGSGNIGATNVLRTGRKGLAGATLLFDVAKGFLAVWIAARLGPDPQALERLGAIAVMIGHCFPVWLRFQGGKGVATLLGVALALEPAYGVAYAGVWALLLVISRYSSVAGLSAAVMLPLIAGFFLKAFLTMMFFAFAVLVMWKHRANLARLLRGEEPRIGESVEADVTRSAPRITEDRAPMIVFDEPRGG